MSDKTGKIRISVVIPAYNAARYLPRALESVLSQTSRADEILVVDNASTDDTAAVVRQYEYGTGVRYLYHKPAGPSAARNYGVKAATGDWIAFLDADDEWLAQKLERQQALLARHPELVWTTGNYHYQQAQQRHPAIDPVAVQALLEGRESWDNYLKSFLPRAGGWTGTMLIRKAVLLEAGLFRLDMPPWEDLDLWWRIAYQHPECGYDAEPLAIYYLDTPGSLSRKPQSLNFIGHFIDQHLALATEYQQTGYILPAAKRIVTDWMRAALFDARIQDIPACLRRFESLITPRWRTMMRLLTFQPLWTLKVCRGLSGISRALRLRRKLFHPTDAAGEPS